jgi:ribosomal-protein-alanine N-acetyltransferase
MFHLQTQHLLLRDLVEDDWQIILQLTSEPWVRMWQDYLPDSSEAKCREWVGKCIFHNNEKPRFAYNLAIVLCSDEAVIGWVGWGHASDKRLGDRDFGYALMPSYWSRGYMTEALVEILSYNFTQADVNSVFGECAVLNYGSARVMEKAGLQLVSRWQEERSDGKRYEMVRYLITRSEWLHKEQRYGPSESVL